MALEGALASMLSVKIVSHIFDLEEEKEKQKGKGGLGVDKLTECALLSARYA